MAVNLVTAPKLNDGLLATAINPSNQNSANTTVTQASTYNPATTTSANYSAATTGSTGYDAAKSTANTYDAERANLNKWAVDNPQLVQNQLANVLSMGGPLMDKAQTRASQQMQAKGLLNSSMAVKAGQAALYDYAVPIATTDANTLANAARFNADAANQNEQFNANAGNTANQFNTGAKNQIGLANQNASNAASQFGAAAANQAALNNQSALNAAEQYKATAANNALLANQNAANNAAQFNASSNNQVGLANASNAAQLLNQNLDQQFKSSLANADNQTKLAMQAAQSQTSQFLAQIEAQYKTEMQNNASMANVIQQYQKNVADIMGNGVIIDAGPEVMQKALDTQQAIVTDQLSSLRNMTNGTVQNLTNFNPAVKATPAQQANTRTDVARLYEDILGRAPDDGGLAYWMRSIDSGQNTLAQVKQAFYNSDEFKRKIG